MNAVRTNECFSAEALLNYLDGFLDQSQCDAIGVHLSGCEFCEAAVQKIESSSGFRLPFSTDAQLLNAPTPDSAVDLGLTGLTRRQKKNRVLDQELVGMFDIPDYQLVSVIGRGGMGVVFKARQMSTNRVVALKVINPAVDDPLAPERKDAIQQRFVAEISAAASIEHDNVVTVHDGHVDDEHQYCAMQLVDGGSLWHRVRNDLNLSDAARYVRDAARGIQAAHDLDILHRDVKPQNILVSARNNRAMVSDFGLAKNIGVNSESIQHTNPNTIVGTLDYISPEQIDSSSAGKAADIYSLGATLYFCLTGMAPFASASVTQQLRNISEQPPVPPRRLRPDIHPDLDAICLKCLEKHPVDRYQSASGLADDIDRFLSGRTTAARPTSIVGHSAKWCRRNPVVAALMATVALLMLSASIAGAVVQRRTNALNRDLIVANEKQKNSAVDLRRALESEKAALGKAEKALSQTRKIARDFSYGVAESPELLQGFDGMQELRRELLTMAKNQLGVLLDPDRLELVSEVVELQLASAMIARQTGDFDGSDRQLVEAEKLCREQLGKTEIATNQELWRYRLSQVLYGRGVSAVNKEDFEQASQLYRNAWDTMCEVSSLNEYRGFLSGQVQLGTVFGNSLLRLGKQDEALNVFDRTEKSADLLYEKIKEKTANGAEHREFKSAYNSIIQFLNTAAVTRTHDKSESFRRLTKCEEVFKNIAPDLLTPENRKLRAGIWMNLSIGYRDLDPTKSIELRKLAVREFRELAELNPKISDFKYNYVKAARNLGKEFASRGDDVASKKQIDEASAALAELMEAEPNSDRYISLQALLFGAQAIYHGSREEYDEAAALLNRKLELNRTLLRKLPKAASRNYNVGFCHFQLAECATVNSRPVPAFFHILAATTYSKKLSGGAKKHLNGLIAQQFEKLLDSILLLD